METVLIQIKNRKAHRLLKDLEDMDIITVLKKKVYPSNQKLSEKYAGKLPQKVAEELQEYVTQGRRKWSSNI